MCDKKSLSAALLQEEAPFVYQGVCSRDTKTVPKYADWFDAFDALEEHLSNLPAK